MEILAITAFCFYCFILLTGSLLAVISRSLVRALVGLMAVMIAVAGMYLLLAAPFVAFMQILIYMGGVGVLIFFAIMLSRASADGDETGPVEVGKAANALVCFLVPAVVFSVIIIYHAESSLDMPADVPPALLGEAMLGSYLLPFELISLVLFAAMAGAVLAAWRKRGEE